MDAMLSLIELLHLVWFWSMIHFISFLGFECLFIHPSVRTFVYSRSNKFINFVKAQKQKEKPAQTKHIFLTVFRCIHCICMCMCAGVDEQAKLTTKMLIIFLAHFNHLTYSNVLFCFALILLLLLLHIHSLSLSAFCHHPLYQI